MSAQLPDRHKRRKFIDGLRRNPSADALLAPDLKLLQAIAQSPNGWHKKALDPYKLAHLKAAKLVTVKGDRVLLTREGSAAVYEALSS